MIGITFFLGKLKGATICSIRNLGKCNDSTENPQHKDGFFSLICRVLSDDKLFFCETLGGGLTMFEIGKLVSKKTTFQIAEGFTNNVSIKQR
jgi:hypothetical protein